MSLQRGKKYLLLLLVGFASYLFTGSIKYYQENKTNKNGTVTLSIVYSASKDEITKNKDIIGNFPFTPELVKSYFSFPGSSIVKAIVYKDPTDTVKRTAVAVELNVTSFSNLSTAKAFKNIKANWVKTDSGYVFTWFVPKSVLQENALETYQFIINSSTGIKSTNGVAKGKEEARWFVFSDKLGGDGAFFVATINSEGIVADSKEDNKPSESSGDKKESCGLFGIELPIIFFGGMMVTLGYRRLKKKKSD